MLLELQIDWHKIFVPTQPLLEIVIRGSCLYLVTLALMRIFRRQAGSLGPADFLVLLFVADAAQNGMAGESKSVTDGIFLIGTIMGWEYLLDWAGYRWPVFQTLLQGSPLLLVKDGHPQLQNLGLELMTLDELASKLRQRGIDDMSQVRACYLEGDGQVSVIAREPQTFPSMREPL